MPSAGDRTLHARTVRRAGPGVVAAVGGHHSQIKPEELTALVSEAQRQGRSGVMVHAHGARGAEEAARAGARSIEHGIFLDEAAVAAMSAAGAWLVPTLSCTQTDPDDLGPEIAAAHRTSVRLALDAGVPVAMGTDNPVRPHSEVLNELRHMSQAGLGDAGALRAATFEAARLLGLADDRGEVAPRKRADLVLLAGTDLDVDDLASRVRQVWHNGAPVFRDRQGPARPPLIIMSRSSPKARWLRMTAPAVGEGGSPFKPGRVRGPRRSRRSGPKPTSRRTSRERWRPRPPRRA